MKLAATGTPFNGNAVVNIQVIVPDAPLLYAKAVLQPMTHSLR